MWKYIFFTFKVKTRSKLLYLYIFGTSINIRSPNAIPEAKIMNCKSYTIPDMYTNEARM